MQSDRATPQAPINPARIASSVPLPPPPAAGLDLIQDLPQRLDDHHRRPDVGLPRPHVHAPVALPAAEQHLEPLCEWDYFQGRDDQSVASSETVDYLVLPAGPRGS